MKIFRQLFLLLSLLCLLSSCDQIEPRKDVPVIDVRAEQAKAAGYYIVQPKENLFFIAWRLNLDYRDIAIANNLSPPYKLQIGQRLSLRKSSAVKSTSFKNDIISTAPVALWQWPVRGKLWRSFSNSTKGIDIVAPLGTPVKASAAGIVVYAGAGIRGYGNLIIIQHNAEYMTAYAHNNTLLVRENMKVNAGQTIATVGSTGTNRVFLHFEMRKAGKAINPLSYLH